MNLSFLRNLYSQNVKFRTLFLAIVIVFSNNNFAIGVSIECNSLEDCLKQLPNVAIQPNEETDSRFILADGGYLIGDVKEQYVAKIRDFGELAVPKLLEYLSHDDEKVNIFAGYILRDIEGLTQDSLATLKYAVLNGIEVLVVPIARIGNEDAIIFLVEQLRVKKNPRYNLDYAFGQVGSKAIPYLIDELKCADNCDEEYLSSLPSLFEKLRPVPDGVTNYLLQIIRDKNYSDIARKQAMLSLAALGRKAHSSVQELNEITQKEPGLFQYVLNLALKMMRHETAADKLANVLNFEEPQLYTIRNLAAYGINAKGIGPNIVELTTHPDWETRVSAARAIGHIGYKEAIRDLTQLLYNNEDWRLTYTSILSLAQLDAVEAVEDLKYIEENHWYPPVRKTAKRAILRIKKIEDPEGELYLKFNSQNYFSYHDIGWEMNNCAEINQIKVLNDPNTKLYHEGNEAALMELSYQEAFQDYEYDEKIDDYVEKKELSYKAIVPTVALKVDDGWLVGTNFGEFGGNLSHLDENGNNYVIIDDNVGDVFQTKAGPVVFTGVAHMVSNYGNIYKLKKNTSGKWFAQLYMTLPGKPFSASMLSDGNILIDTFGGTVIYTPQGILEMATCVSEKRPFD